MEEDIKTKPEISETSRKALNTKKTWFLTIAVTSGGFVCGIIVGAILMQAVLFKMTIKEFSRRGFKIESHIKKIQENLDLTNEQVEKFRKLLEEHRKNMEAIHKNVRPMVETELESFRKKVEAILTPEQAKKWNEQFKEKMSQMLPPLPPPPPERFKNTPPHRFQGGGN